MKINIIDLLNKIYNKDNIPQRIIYNNCLWEYSDVYSDFKDGNENYLFVDFINRYDDIRYFLKSEVEITKEDKKIEKLNDKARYYFSTVANGMTKRDREALDEMFEKCYKTIDELIDEINKLKEKL